MSDLWIRVALSAVAAILVCVVAVQRGLLSPSGAFAATAVGTALVTGAGWWAGVCLVMFFLTSSFFGRALHPSDDVQARGSRRDATQVLANGGVAAFLAIVALSMSSQAVLVGIIGAIAAANADTFSTEIGKTSPRPPRVITTGRIATTGTSGAVSARGLTAAVGGALCIGLTSAAGSWLGLWPAGFAEDTTIVTITCAGFIGSLADSVIGATIQCHRWCPTCTRYTEQDVHHCGTPTSITRGLWWVTNDVVNMACCIVGAIVAMVLIDGM